jgi:hypothetical protein
MKKILAVILLTLLTPVLAWGQGYWDPNGFAYTPQLTTQGTTDYANIVTSQARIDAILGASPYIGGATTIAGAVTAIGSTTPATLHVPPGTWPVAANTTITANILLKPERGAIISIPTGVTLNLNGPFEAGLYQVFSCAGTGAVVFGRPSGVKELVPQWWGAVGNDIHDDTAALNAMVVCACNSGGLNMFCSAGEYLLNDTLKLGLGAAYVSFTFRGANGGGINSGTYSTVFDATGFGDRPAINVAGARQVVLEDFVVIGKNAAAQTTASGAYSNYPTKANWITAGCVDSQHSPYCGICFDADYGTTPGDPYPNFTYGATCSCSGVIMKNVKVQGFVVGLMNAPYAASPQDGGPLSVYDCAICYNTYNYSCGSSQCDTVSFNGGYMTGAWVDFETMQHGGSEQGFPVSIYGGVYNEMFKMFEIGSANGNAPKIISAVHLEAFGYLGEFGATDSGGACTTTFVGCSFDLNQTFSHEPYLFIANQQINFVNVQFGEGSGTRYVLNYNNSHQTKFDGCKFSGFTDTASAFIGLAYAFGFPFLQSYDNCEVESIAYTSGGAYLNINDEYRGLASTARQFIAPYTHTVRTWANYGYTNYKVNLPQYGYWTANNISVSGAAITGTGQSAVLTFTAGSAGDWAVGDIIFWQVPARTGPTAIIPAFRVTVASGTAITAQSLVDNVNVSWTTTFDWAEIAIPLFFNPTPSTGSTHSNTTLDSVTNITNWAIGDWINGAGIPANTRITNIVGTTLTLSRAATATATGVSIYNCGLTAY